jgi:hypothetical protein
MISPEPELTQEQISARKKVEEQYGGGERAEQYYGHIIKLLASDEQQIRDKHEVLLPKDLKFFEERRDRALERLRALGFSPDLDKLYEEEENKFKDLRE